MPPIYDYECLECRSITEVITKRPDDTVRCTKCGSEDTQRLISACGWELKGPDWFNPSISYKRARGGIK